MHRHHTAHTAAQEWTERAMLEKITREQYEDIENARFFDVGEYHKLLEEYAGIIAKPYTAFAYYDSAGNYIGDSENSDTMGLLKFAYIEVIDNG